MTLLDKLAHLEEQIKQFLELHANPHDTSAHDAVAEKLNKLLPLLNKATLGSDGTNKSISASVGNKGTNKVADVKVVQTFLKLKVDGDCGPKTEKAIKDFQRDNDIKPVSGLIEPNSPTWNKLAGVTNNSGNDDTSEPSTSNGSSISASVGVKGENKIDDVKAVQTLLKIVVDGDCGPKSKKAIKEFQQDNDIKPVSGLIEPGSTTWNKLAGIKDTVSDDTTNEPDQGGDSTTDTGTTTPVDSTNEEMVSDDPNAPKGNDPIKGSVGKDGRKKADNNKADVVTVQELLKKRWGYGNIGITGILDTATQKAITNFQRETANTRNPDGRIDAGGNTWKKLKTGKGSPAALKAHLDGITVPDTYSEPDGLPETTIKSNFPITGAVGKKRFNYKGDVITVQRLLHKAGYTDVPLTGDCDDATIAIIEKFQKSKSIGADGVISAGGTTWQKLSGKAMPKSNPIGTKSWKNNKQAYVIGTDTEVVKGLLDKIDTDPSSPKFLDSRTQPEKAAGGGANDYLYGKAEVARPKQSNAALNSVYGTVKLSDVSPNEGDSDQKARAAFEKNYITSISAPFPLLNVYNGRVSSKIKIHKKVASSLKSALQEIHDFYGGIEVLRELGLDRYGGAWVYRRIRGGSSPSSHAWGIAIDLCPSLNPLRGKDGDALFAEAQYTAFIDIMEKHGFYNLGKCKDYDYMHFQAAIPTKMG